MKKRLTFVGMALLLGTSAFAQTTTLVPGPTIKLSWAKATQGTSTTAGVTTPITLTGTTSYNVYQGACNPSATFVKVQTGIAGTSAVVSQGIVPGVTYGFRVTAVNAALSVPESAQSMTVCAVVSTTVATSPPPVNTPTTTMPNAPALLVVLTN
jgi:hypothetical protein